jgi:hypothetical protein
MPVSTTHPIYDKFRPQWDRIQNVMDGEDSVRAGGETYLPKVNTAQETADYNAYNARACFFNGTKRTAEAMAGFIFRKPPTIKTSQGKEFTENVDMRGSTLAGYCRKVATAASSKGRSGTLIDWNAADNRPYLSFFAAEDIINWRVSNMGGRLALTLLVLHEWVTAAGVDEFDPVAKEQWTVFRLKPEGVTVEKWQAETPKKEVPGTTRPNPDPGAVIVSPETALEKNGRPLEAIPFVFHNSDEPGACVSVPPLNDIASVNIHHWQASAEIANARHACATPTPYAVGFGNNETKLYLGTTHAWTTDTPGASAGFVEPQGNGLASLKEACEEHLAMMAALGARLIEPTKKEAEAYETVQLRASAETSTLARITLLTSEGLSEVLRWAAWWVAPAAQRQSDFRDTEFVALNTDYASARLSAQELTALCTARQQDLISYEEFFFNMQRGEMYSEGATAEEELKRIKMNPAMPPEPPPAPPRSEA